MAAAVNGSINIRLSLFRLPVAIVPMKEEGGEHDGQEHCKICRGVQLNG